MSTKNNTKSVEETFKKKTQLEHIIDIPDTYIGSIEKTDVDTWIFDEENEKIIYKNIKYIPGLYKIFDEVLVNAIDQHVRTENDEKIINKVTVIKVNFDVDNNTISVYNNGEGIPIVEHKEHNVWIPELIFGHLLTSSNYDKDEKKITGGKNGYGAKLANIFSKRFKIETVDAERKLKYVQVFENNMNTKGTPIITPSGNTKPYTIIEFSPDLDRFCIDKLNEDTILLMKKRVIDITACTNKNVSVFLNDKKLECKTLEKYVNYYLDSSTERVYEEVNDRWEVVIAVNPDTKFEQVSFVNGISTLKGGKHVDYVVNSIVKKVQTYVSTKGIKRKKLDLKPVHIKDNIFVFIRSTVENPAFDSQIKEYLTTASTKFGSKCEVSDKFIEKLVKTALIERAMKLSDFKDNLGLQKVSGKKITAIRGVDKLDDANKAGGPESLKCTLILTEGDSAKALAIAGLSVVGRDHFGVFPLRGKLLNAREIDIKRVGNNAEISNLVKIMGLKFGDKNKKKNKEDTLKDLRYGKIMIFTDADVDGSHIKGLLINLFAIFWPELLEIPGFIISLATPIIKVKSKEKKNGDVKEFYTMTEFNDWKDAVENIKKWDIKYYKGLGTSTAEEGKEYFVDFDKKNILYTLSNGDEDEDNKNKSINKIELAFDKKRSEDRKSWLKTYDKDNIIEQTQKSVLYHEFIDRELIHFSDYDCKRSIACLCDGLKPSLRKIIYSCFKKNLKKEIKVAQLAGYIGENSAYHHGEVSLYESIIGLSQDFVGSNNINLLEPRGQFGSRVGGGDDAASPRYIFTCLNELTYHIYNPLDNPLLEYNEDDGQLIEPTWYIPILPMILINGTEGIGTGYSTKIPPHDPEIVVKNLFNLMDDKPLEKMIPWFRGFKGLVEFKGINDFGLEQYMNKGTFKYVDDTTVIINELPIGKWIDDYKIFLESLLYDKSVENKASKQCLVDFSNNSTEKTVSFTLKFKKEELSEMRINKEIESVFKLTDSKNTNYFNMNLYNNKGIITKYERVDDILKEFYFIRLAFYSKRKDYMLNNIKKDLDIFESKIRFIQEFISGEINILHKEDHEITKMLEEREYPKFNTKGDTKKEKEIELNNEEENEKDNDEESFEIDDDFNYEYLLNMKIKSLTKKKIEELKKMHENKLALYNDLYNKTDKELWKNDLNKFLDLYKVKTQEYNDKMNKQVKPISQAKTVKKMVVTKKKVTVV
jgi:DNA topoisomerase-2